MTNSGEQRASEDELGTYTRIASSRFAGETPSVVPVGRDGRVQIAYLHEHRVSHSFHVSLMNLLVWDKIAGSNLIESAPYMVAASGPNGIPEGRNLAVRNFLDETPHEWLFFVDTDMGFEPDSLERLVKTASADERPIVGGLCFAARQVSPDGFGGFNIKPLPTIFQVGQTTEGNLGFVGMLKYERDSVVQVAGTGAAFLLIHRDVLSAMRTIHGDRWFDCTTYADGTTQVSEDLSFCFRAGLLQAPIHVDTSVKTTHHKDIWIGEAAYDMPDESGVYGG